MYRWDILCGILKGTFEIPHKISYPYIERYNVEILRALRFKSSQAFLKCPQSTNSMWWVDFPNIWDTLTFLTLEMFDDFQTVIDTFWVFSSMQTKIIYIYHIEKKTWFGSVGPLLHDFFSPFFQEIRINSLQPICLVTVSVSKTLVHL